MSFRLNTYWEYCEIVSILELYRRTHVERLANTGFKTGENDDDLICNVIQNVYIHPSANVHTTATV